ncbi:MAG: arginine repressor [Phycisphaeraceae bacterium]|nr:MAG: arginine repressor [Phycisphaeraceae bacterium]
MSRARRHAVLSRILRDRPAATQEQIAAALNAAGEPVTQATVSRDLAAIGAVRGPGGYQLPDLPAPAGQRRLAPTFREHAVSVEPAANLVVVRTAPGHASVIASELDAARPAGMVGCVAGDDTVMIATPSAGDAAALTEHLIACMEGA